MKSNIIINLKGLVFSGFSVILFHVFSQDFCIKVCLNEINFRRTNFEENFLRIFCSVLREPIFAKKPKSDISLKINLANFLIKAS